MRNSRLFLSGALLFCAGVAVAADDDPVGRLKPVAWYDAAAADTLSGRGGRVGEWRDRSGNHHALKVPEGFTGPAVQPGAIGGRNALRFNGKSDCLVTALTPAVGKSPRTTFAVVRPVAHAGRSHIYLYGSPVDGGCYGVGYEGGCYQLIYWNRFGVTGQMLSTMPLVLTQRFDGKVDTLSRNLEPAFATFDNMGETGRDYPLHVGARISPAEFYQGMIGELIFFDRMLTPEEEESVKQYLIKKWSIETKMSDDPLTLDAILFGAAPEYRVNWWGKGRGLMRSPRDVGMVVDEEYRRQAAPILEAYLKQCTDPDERLAVAMRLTELGSAAGFEILLDALDAEADPIRRSSEIQVYVNPGIADHILTLIGNASQYDANGSDRLRREVTRRWRRQFAENPQALLAGLAPRQPRPGVQRLKIADLNLELPMEDMEFFYYLAGSRLYSIGTMDGRFPPLGRTLGTQSGFWAQPCRLLEKIAFAVKDENGESFALDDCTEYTSTMATVNFHFEKSGLEIDRCDYIIEDETAFVSEITIANPGDAARRVSLSAEAFVDLRPGNRMRPGNDLDRLVFQGDLLQAYDPALKYALCWGADRPAAERRIIDNRGVSGFQIELPPGEKATVAFVLTGAKTPAAAAALWGETVRNRPRLKAERQAKYEEIFSDRVRFASSNPELDAAFACAKVNLHMLKNSGGGYFPNAYFFGGMPDYPEMFGTDSCFSLPGMLAANEPEMARGVLDNFRRCAELQQGRVPHEVLPNNQIISPGNLQETPQWILAVGQYVDWTGDLKFGAACYDLAEAGIARTLAACGNDGRLYPVGYSLGEEAGLHDRNVDTVCFLYAALKAMEKLSAVLGKDERAAYYRSLVETIEKDFRADWWNDEVGIWANALDGREKKMYGYVNSTFPLNVGLAEPADARRALALMRKNCVNNWMWNRPPGEKFNTCAFHNSHFGMAAFRYGDTAFGMERMKLNASIISMDGLGAYENTNPVGDDIYQLWGIAGVMELYIKGLAGINPDLPNRIIRWAPHDPQELEFYKVENLRIGQNVLTFEYHSSGSWRVIFVSGDGPLHFELTLPDGKAEKFDLSPGREQQGK